MRLGRPCANGSSMRPRRGRPERPRDPHLCGRPCPCASSLRRPVDPSGVTEREPPESVQCATFRTTTTPRRTRGIRGFAGSSFRRTRPDPVRQARMQYCRLLAAYTAQPSPSPRRRRSDRPRPGPRLARGWRRRRGASPEPAVGRWPHTWRRRRPRLGVVAPSGRRRGALA